MKLYVRHLFTTALYVLFSASFALGASVTVQSSGDGVFVIHGNGMDGVAGIDLLVDYDKSSLVLPKVDQGNLVSGRAMFAANPNFAPGTIKVAIISPTAFSGSGQLAVITFASHTGTGSIAVSANMINSKGLPVSSGGKSAATDFQASTTNTPGLITAAGIPFSQTSATATATTGTTASSSTPAKLGSSMPTYLGTVSMPQDVQAKSGNKPAETSDASVQFTVPAATKNIETPVEEKLVTEPQKPEKVTTTYYKGTLDNFRTYKGEKSPISLIALFNNKIAPTIRQEPAVVLSDGKTSLKIMVTLETTDDKSPNFVLNGAKLVSLNRDEASSTWIVEVLPQAGAVQASLTVLTGDKKIEYPLTVAPLIERVSSEIGRAHV